MLRRCSFFFAAASLLLLAACSSEKKTPAALLADAIAAGKQGDWKSALSISDDAVEIAPGNRDILLFSALAMENNGHLEEAINRVQSIASDPNDFMVQYTLGRMLFKQGRMEQCIAPLKAAEQASPRDINTLILLAKASLRLNTKDAADYQKKLLSFPAFINSPVVFNELGVVFALRGRPREALAFLLDRRATLPVSVLNAAIIHDWHLNEKNRAADLYNKYLRLTARSPELERERIAVTRRLQEIR
jgi:Flp pilus assembly protein TadD